MADIAEECASASWNSGPAPDVCVGVPTHQRSGFLAAVVAALEAQTVPRERLEVIVVDNASADDTWETLQKIVASTPLRMRAMRSAENAGVANSRNTIVRAARAPVVAFTDDDCIPSPGWLEALTAPFAAGADLVQGRVRPDPNDYTPAQPWARTLWVNNSDWLFESANIAYRRSSFEAAGGFDVLGPDGTELRRPFGEDTTLAWRMKAAGMRTVFADDALVYHRVFPGTFGGWLSELRRRALFPGLVGRSPGLRRSLYAGVFLNKTTAAFDLALAGAIAAAIAREPLILLAGIPYLVLRVRDARGRPGRPVVFRLAQLGVGDVVGFLSLLQGSVRERQIVL